MGRCYNCILLKCCFYLNIQNISYKNPHYWNTFCFFIVPHIIVWAFPFCTMKHFSCQNCRSHFHLNLRRTLPSGRQLLVMQSRAICVHEYLLAEWGAESCHWQFTLTHNARACAAKTNTQTFMSFFFNWEISVEIPHLWCYTTWNIKIIDYCINTV